MQSTIKERPILFSAPMIRSILDGSKTQTRRLVKGMALDWLENAKFIPEYVASAENDMCQYGKVGEQLWARETFCLSGYASDPDEVLYRADEEYTLEDRGDLPWKPSIFMPRWASRIQLEIISVRVERLRDITEPDCLAEGVVQEQITPTVKRTAYSEFKNLWCSINGGDSWDANPWVWVVQFKRVNK